MGTGCYELKINYHPEPVKGCQHVTKMI